uniref:Septin-type G domain-containing protein n=1 Tax=Amphilophus citrinellus TaxID=61819 RepID=A0A3Q0R1Q2_AMPCI
MSRKNILIHSGPPAVYQLRPKKQKLGTLTRMTVGEKKPNKINKTILHVGETGAGKSTLINALINYSMGVKFEDEVWFQIVDEERRSQAEGQTSDVIVYEIFGYEDQTLPYSLTIIDTPGYGDTRGIEYDDIISERLLDLFGSDDGVAEIHAVGLVMKATENRLSDRLMYVFNSVMSLFGKNMEKQIVAFITHSDGKTPKNALEALEAAKIKCAKNKKNEPVHFLFDNRQHEERTEENEASSKHSWDITQTGMDHMMEFLGKSGSQKLMTTVEVLKERIRLKACIQNLRERINLTELKQTEIRETEEAVKKHEEEMKKNQKFTVEVDEVYKDYEEIKLEGSKWTKWWFVLLGFDKAVCCKVCEENCHYPGCTMALIPEHCEVIRRGRCTVCTKKCPASSHVKEKKKYVPKTRKVQKTIKDLKEKYEKSKEESEKESSILENLKKEMIKLTAEKKQWFYESYQHVIRLEKIALNVDAVSTIVHLDFLIEKMKEEEDTEKVQKLEEMRSRVDERTRAAHWYKFTQIQSGIRNIGKSFPWKK